jgi:hypothetical protein
VGAEGGGAYKTMPPVKVIKKIKDLGAANKKSRFWLFLHQAGDIRSLLYEPYPIL